MSSTTSPPAGAGEQSRGVRSGVGAWIVNRSIRTKLLAAIGLLSIVAIASGIVAANGLKGAGKDIEALAKTQVTVGVPVQTIHQDEIKARMQIAQLALASPADKAKWLQYIKDNDAEIAGAVAEADPILTSPAAKGMTFWPAFKAEWAQFVKIRDGVLVPLATKNDYAG